MNPVDAIITKVERQKKQAMRYNIFINEEFAFSVHEDILIKHRLIKGETIDKGKIEEIIRDEERSEAYQQAIRYITRKPRTSKELEKKLKEKGYESSSIEAAIARLSEQKFVNDQLFARQWTDERVRVHKKGRRWIQQELKQKGISAPLISSALENLDKEEERKSAQYLAKKRWKQLNGEVWQKKRKLGAFLARRGFPSDIVQEILRKFGSAGDEYDEIEQHHDADVDEFSSFD